jgi:Domain of unknown function (DUF4398)
MRLAAFSACIALAGLGGASTGCGGTLYAINASSAASRIEEAKELGAEQTAPYEYYYAKAHLEQAQVDAAEASYGDAVDYAETAEEYAEKAIKLAKEANKAAGR